jgi:hypothetical protein
MVYHIVYVFDTKPTIGRLNELRSEHLKIQQREEYIIICKSPRAPTYLVQLQWTYTYNYLVGR